MSEQSCVIRPATVRDAPALLEIYAPYVEQTAITFEYTVPSLEDFTGRIRKTLEVYPYLVAQQDGRILGYAYADRFQQRAAYDWAVEVSVYIRHDARHLGLGRPALVRARHCEVLPSRRDQKPKKQRSEIRSAA